MVIPIVGVKTGDQKAQEIADMLNGLRSTQLRIIEALRGFKTDIESIATVLTAQQKEIDRINRRQRNKAKRGGDPLDAEEEENQDDIERTEPASG